MTTLQPVRFGEVGRVEGFTLIAFEFKDERGETARTLFRVRSIYDREIDQAFKHLVPMPPYAREEVPFLTA